MILQALNDYYDRLRKEENPVVPEFGFSIERTAFSIVLSREGDVVQVRDLRSYEGKREVLRPAVLPKPPRERSGTKAPSYCLWDKSKYILGCESDAKGNPSFSEWQFVSFKNENLKVLSDIQDDGATALRAFIAKREFGRLPDWANEDLLKGRFIVFELDGENCFLHERNALRQRWLDYLESQKPSKIGQCLVTGEAGVPIPETHLQMKGVQGAQPAGAALLSFNASAFESFGRGQNNLNAPVSERAAFGYTTALNHLLAPGSERKAQIGDTTVVFWTDAPAVDSELMFSFAVSGRRADDENLALRLEKQLSSIARGRFPDELGDPQTRFYVLGLSPNAARLSVRFWHVATVGEIVRNIGLHYSHLALKRNFDNEPEHPGPWWILKELAPQRDSRNISPLLSGQIVKAIVQNTPYPRTMLTAAVGRIRADKHVNYLRASVIKAYLVRNTQQELQMTLDTGNTDIGYRLGRLFAMVERVQEEAVPGANATVRDRFFGSASATPARTFPIILRNAQHGLAKIRKDKKGLAVHLEKGIQEIVSGMDAKKGFPASMNLESQGMFILGYYQQRQDQFTKKEEKTEE